MLVLGSLPWFVSRCQISFIMFNAPPPNESARQQGISLFWLLVGSIYNTVGVAFIQTRPDRAWTMEDRACLIAREGGQPL
mgnify:CR=1 FL=1|jgi:hypothetical protein